jgi:hypothetical protein
LRSSPPRSAAPAAGRPPPPARRRLSLGRFVAAVTATATVALAIAAVPVFVLKPRPAQRTAARGITAVAGQFGIVPIVGTVERRAIKADLAAFLRTLYEDAFLSTNGGAAASPSPSPQIEKFFAPRARAALASRPDVFSPGTGVDVLNGQVTFNGVVTTVGHKPTRAYLNVLFVGNGSVRTTPVRISQDGQLLLLRSEQGWLVAGFDVKLKAASVTPSPSATAK